MSSVFSFWRLPEEEATFLDYLDRTEDMVACVYTHSTDPADLQAAPLRELIADRDPEDILIAPRPFMDMTPIFSLKLDGELNYSRYYGDGPVICYTRPQWREPGQLGRSNLCYNSQRGLPDPDGTEWYHSVYVPQPPEFLAWGRRVMAWNRRHTKPHGHYRATPGALAAAAAGDIELVF